MCPAAATYPATWSISIFSSFLFPLRRTQDLDCFDLLLMADGLNERPGLV